jgi:hypothetical protein
MHHPAIRGLTAALAAASLAGCVVSINDDDDALAGTDPVPPPPRPMVCDAGPAQRHLGKEATQAVGEAALKDSGARTLRWGAPGSAWTMDFREDRVNVRYDGRMQITEITCG